MQIAIVGTGQIGSVFAYQLAKAGHAVTVVARGERLAQLRRENAILLVTGERAPVTVKEALDTETPYDLVLVPLRAPQLEAVMPSLRESAAKTVMFMFNTFEPLDGLRAAVGTERFTFGFPAMFATLPDGKLKHTIATRGQITTVTDAAWAKVFTEAGILTVVHDDMHSWLRSHAAFVVPLMAVGSLVAGRGGKGITWAEARKIACASDEGYRIVRNLGNKVTPGAVVALSRMPTSVVAFIMWALSRTQTMRDLGAFGPDEARMLIDMMTAAAPGKTEALRAIRP